MLYRPAQDCSRTYGAVSYTHLLPRVLSVNAGFMDAAAFLALKGLFTAHVTGNFVTLGASLVTGTSGALAKLLALPVFCIVIILARLLGHSLRERSRRCV